MSSQLSKRGAGDNQVITLETASHALFFASGALAQQP
jgi:hypothetical protein